MDAALVMEVLRSSVAALLMAAGFMLIAGGGIGLLRFPDVYTRLHAANVADTFGTAVVIVGLVVLSGDLSTALRLGLLAALVLAIGPTLTHLVAAAAHAGGLAPIAGRYAAPRPGASRKDVAP
jgi:multicomponent Na+:H+ antiporter subunit G